MINTERDHGKLWEVQDALGMVIFLKTRSYGVFATDSKAGGLSREI